MKLLRFFGKSLRVLLVTAGILIVLVAGGLFAVLKKPELIFNPKVFRVAAGVAGRFGVLLAWDEARIQVQSKRLLHKRFDFSFDHFCFNLSANRYQGCMGELRLVAEVAWLDGGLKVLELGPLTMSQADLSLHLAPGEKQAPKPPEPFRLQVPDLVLPDFLKATRFHPIDLQWKRLTVWQEEKMLFTGPLRLQMSPDDRGRPESLALDLKLEEGMDLPAGQLSARLQSPANFWLNDWTLKATVDAALPGKYSGKADLSLAPRAPGAYAIQLQGSGAYGKTRGNLQLRANLSEGHLNALFSAEARGFSPQVHGVSARACKVDVRQWPARLDRMRLNLDCPLRVDVTPLRLPSATYSNLVTLPQNFDFVLKTELESRFFPSFEDPVAGKLDLELVPISQQLLTLRGHTSTQFSGVPARFPRDWQTLTQLDFFATVPRFEEVVRVLDKTAFAVFAPLNALSGSVEFGVKGEADLLRSWGKLPLEFRTRLRSRDQAFHSDGKGELEFEVAKVGTKAKLLLELTLGEVKLVLPHLGLQSLPQLIPDPRFIDPKKEVKKASGELGYEIQVKTLPDQPVRLVSNLTKESIPLFLDLQATPAKLGGTVKIGKTPLSILRRNVSIQNFSIALAEPTDFSELNGTIRVDYANYDIDVLVLGTVKRPRIVFQSNPPLSEEEIISVLIYGQPFQSLDTGDSNSVSNVASAVADRALRLSSLFLLASTPVESVGYDPATGYVSARLRLGGATSLEVGTAEGRTQKVGLRKNIGGNWIINTYIENDSDEGSQRGGAFLDWYKRY